MKRNLHGTLNIPRSEASPKNASDRMTVTLRRVLDKQKQVRSFSPEFGDFDTLIDIDVKTRREEEGVTRAE